MISDDTLMGTSLMTFHVQGTAWFGPSNFTEMKQRWRKSPGLVLNLRDTVQLSPCSTCNRLINNNIRTQKDSITEPNKESGQTVLFCRCSRLYI